jgi:diaminopimelate decarboxylase
MSFTKTCLLKEEMSKVFAIALFGSDLIHDDDTSVLFYDLSYLTERIQTLKGVFPTTTLHAIAIKSNPLTKILSLFKDLDIGMEAASGPELYLSEKAGIPSNKIVFDSPAKTLNEIEYALIQGIRLNADSFEELDRIGSVLKSVKSESIIGIRINPQIGAGAIKSTSVAETDSKFGIPLNDNIDRLKDYFIKYEWLNGVHVHIGSQGCPVSNLIEGIRKVLDFTIEMNHILKQKSLRRKIGNFDLGGGLPVSYYPGTEPVSIGEYRRLLEEDCPELFTGEFKLITEFGRYIHANTGWAVSRVEYVKREKDHNIAMIHVGADLLLRKCYNPEDWHHQLTVVDQNGTLKTGKDQNKYIVAGPLCFAGDVIATDLELPPVETGDYILIHDTGAYTLSMWSRYNSRQIPKVIGYRHKGKEFTFEIIKEREDKEKIYDFWS